MHDEVIDLLDALILDIDKKMFQSCSVKPGWGIQVNSEVAEAPYYQVNPAWSLSYELVSMDFSEM